MPTHSDREKWWLLLGEYQYRALSTHGHSLDGGHTHIVPVPDFFRAVADYFKA